MPHPPYGSSSWWYGVDGASPLEFISPKTNIRVCENATVPVVIGFKQRPYPLSTKKKMASGLYRPALGVDQHLTELGSTAGASASKDFPIVCETCLGESPFVRMIKMRFGSKLCKITQRPFQSFRWKAGPRGRFKETVVCREVAIEKNICQACLSDMRFGVPVGVRDALLTKEDRNEEPSRELVDLARSIHGTAASSETTDIRFRNLPKLCSFWTEGKCTRRVCPFRPCCGTFKFPELASTHPELCKSLVDALRAKQPPPPEALKALGESRAGVNVDDAIRDRVHGKDQLSKKYLLKAASVQGTETPSTTVWVGGDFGRENVLSDAMYRFGDIEKVTLSDQCAYVRFAEIDSASRAVKAGNLLVNNVRAPVGFATNKAADAAASSPSHHTAAASGGAGSSRGELRPDLKAALDAAFGPKKKRTIPPPPPPPAKYPSTDPHRLGA